MNSAALLEILRDRGLELAVDGENIAYRAPKGVLTPELRRAMTEGKAELLPLLAAETSLAEAGSDGRARDDADATDAGPRCRVCGQPHPASIRRTLERLLADECWWRLGELLRKAGHVPPDIAETHGRAIKVPGRRGRLPKAEAQARGRVAVLEDYLDRMRVEVREPEFQDGRGYLFTRLERRYRLAPPAPRPDRPCWPCGSRSWQFRAEWNDWVCTCCGLTAPPRADRAVPA